MAAKRLTNPFDYRFGRVPQVWAGRADLLAIIKASVLRPTDAFRFDQHRGAVEGKRVLITGAGSC